MIKRFLLFNLLTTLCGVSGAVAADQYVQVGKNYYKLSTTASATYAGYYEAEITTPDGRMQWDPGVYDGDVEVPQYFTYESTDYVVTSVGNNAFCNQTTVTAVKLPESIVTIGQSAFKSTLISEFTVPAECNQYRFVGVFSL